MKAGLTSFVLAHHGYATRPEAEPSGNHEDAESKKLAPPHSARLLA